MKKANMMKKIAMLLTASICGLVLAFGLTGCADANGLHNQESSTLTFVFKGFDAAVDGDYAIPGEYNSWNNSVAQITLKDGCGTSTTSTLGISSFKFTLVKVDSWSRAWYPAIKGNSVDSGTVYSNFYIDGYTLGGDLTVTVDGTTGAAVVTVQ